MITEIRQKKKEKRIKDNNIIGIIFQKDVSLEEYINLELSSCGNKNKLERHFKNQCLLYRHQRLCSFLFNRLVF